MPDVQVKTRSGAATAVPSRSVDSLTAALRGQLLFPGSADYDAARTIWNAMIDRGRR